MIQLFDWSRNPSLFLVTPPDAESRPDHSIRTGRLSRQRQRPGQVQRYRRACSACQRGKSSSNSSAAQSPWYA